MTGLDELKVELQVYVAECQRLRAMLDELLAFRKDVGDPEKGDTIEKQHAQIKSLKRENGELANACRLRDDEITRLNSTVEELNKALTATKQRAQASPEAKRAKENVKEIEILKKEITRLKKNAANAAHPQPDASPPRVDPVLLQRAEEAERSAQRALEDLEAERRARSDETQDHEAALGALKQQLQILVRQKEQVRQLSNKLSG